MNKLLFATLSSLIISPAFAAESMDVHSPANSFSQAVLERQSNQYRDRADTIEATETNSYHHSDEQTNSLARAVLAKQGVNENIVITSTNQISTSQYDPDDDHNSLLRAALSMHYKATH